MDNETKTILFGPREGKTLRKMYPEIEGNPIFKGIDNNDLLFAWYMGIPNSPVDHDLDFKMRCRTAANKCFKDQEKKQAFSNGDFTDDIKGAINEFKKFSPEARSAAKNIVQKIFQNFEKMVDVDIEKDFIVKRTIGKGDDKVEVEEVDWTAKKQYVDSATKISETLPSLLKQIEEGFGIADKKSDEGSGKKSIDKFHENKKNNKSS